MSTKYFHWDGGVAVALADMKYPEGAPVEYGITKCSVLAVQAWHGLNTGQRTAIIQRLRALGWTEGEQSKPD